MDFTLIEYGGGRNVTTVITSSGNSLALGFSAAECGEVLWPDYRHIHRADGLWQSTCFELFLGSPAETGYIEFNFSPSGAWNCYEFSDYRQGMQVCERFSLVGFTADRASSQLDVTLTCKETPKQLTLAPAAVLQNPGKSRGEKSLSYFAPAHGAAPDFHEDSCRVLAQWDAL